MKIGTIERESKILEIDVSVVISKLEELGAKKTFVGQIYSVFFDTHDQSLKERGHNLRIRNKCNVLDSTEKCEVTLKTFIGKSDIIKEYDEFEFISDSFENTLEFFRKLCYVEKYRIIKHRISYSLSDVSFEIDKYPDIPDFLEIEAPDVKKIEEYANILGFSKENLLPYSMKELFKKYNLKREGRKDF